MTIGYAKQGLLTIAGATQGMDGATKATGATITSGYAILDNGADLHNGMFSSSMIKQAPGEAAYWPITRGGFGVTILVQEPNASAFINAVNQAAGATQVQVCLLTSAAAEGGSAGTILAGAYTFPVSRTQATLVETGITSSDPRLTEQQPDGTSTWSSVYLSILPQANASMSAQSGNGKGGVGETALLPS